MRSVFAVAAALTLGIACSSTTERSSPADAAAADVASDGAGIVSACPSSPSALAACPAGIKWCHYYAKVDTCGVQSCPCGPPATVSTDACASQDGCTMPTDNTKLCAPGLACNEGEGCVLQWCGRSCLCGADEKYHCAPDGC